MTKGTLCSVFNLKLSAAVGCFYSVILGVRMVDRVRFKRCSLTACNAQQYKPNFTQQNVEYLSHVTKQNRLRLGVHNIFLNYYN